MRRAGVMVPVVRYGMGGVQSVPRVMRGVPVARGSIHDVPLSKRHLAGLESQGLARTLGVLGNDSIGADEIEMPEECMRPGEILLAPGVCGPDTRQPINPYASPSEIVPTGTKLQTDAPAATSAKSAVASMSRTTMLLAAVGAAGLIYYLGRKR